MKITLSFFILFSSVFILSAMFNTAEAGGRCSNPVYGDGDYNRQCGIWICLPGGFPSDCGEQKAAFELRLGPGRMKPCPNILPDYSRCTGKAGGSYKMGREEFYPCQEGYTLRTYRDEGEVTGRCEDRTSRNRWGNDDNNYYDSYPAEKRRKQNFIDVFVDGEAYPRYWW